MSKITILKEIIEYAGKNKKYWLLPIIFFILFLAVIIILSSNAVVMPFIYTVF